MHSCIYIGLCVARHHPTEQGGDEATGQGARLAQWADVAHAAAARFASSGS